MIYIYMYITLINITYGFIYIFFLLWTVKCLKKGTLQLHFGNADYFVWKYFTTRISKHYGDAFFYIQPFSSILIPGDYWGKKRLWPVCRSQAIVSTHHAVVIKYRTYTGRDYTRLYASDGGSENQNDMSNEPCRFDFL